MSQIIPPKNSLAIKKQRQQQIKRVKALKTAVQRLGPQVLKKLDTVKNLKTGYIERNVKKWNSNQYKQGLQSTKGRKTVQQNAIGFLKGQLRKMQKKATIRRKK